MPSTPLEIPVPPALDPVAEVARLQAALEASSIHGRELASSLSQAMSTIAQLKLQLGRLQTMLFGRRSERCVGESSPPLPGLVLPAPETPAPKESQVQAHARRTPAPPSAQGWNGFPAELKREPVVHDLPEDRKAGRVLIGQDVTERLAHRSEWYVQQHIYLKYAVPGEPMQGVVQAAAAACALSPDSNRAHFDLSVAVHVVFEKFVNHMPFHRQSEDLARQGITLGRSLMCEWAGRIAFLCQPLHARLEELLRLCPVLHADETTVRMLALGKCARCHIWARMTGVGPPAVVFRFATGRSQRVAGELLGDFVGTFIVDGYIGYENLPGIRAACWAHARRKFFEAPGLADPRRLQALELIRQLYRNESSAAAQAAERDGETALLKARKVYREGSAAVAEAYFRLCGEILASGTPPSSPLVQAAAYSMNRKAELSVYLHDPKVAIDNNPVENIIRPWALGRKNWLFVGSEDGGQSAAVIESLVATCRLNGVDFEAWLNDILPRLGDIKSGDQPALDALLPQNWKRLPAPAAAADAADAQA